MCSSADSLRALAASAFGRSIGAQPRPMGSYTDAHPEFADLNSHSGSHTAHTHSLQRQGKEGLCPPLRERTGGVVPERDRDGSERQEDAGQPNDVRTRDVSMLLSFARSGSSALPDDPMSRLRMVTRRVVACFCEGLSHALRRFDAFRMFT